MHVNGSDQTLSGWTYKVVGHGVSKVIKTNSKGIATAKNIKPGRYTVQNVQAPGSCAACSAKTIVIKNGQKRTLNISASN